MSLEKQMMELDFLSKSIQLDLIKGDLSWDDEKVQFIILAVLHFTDWDWLKLIAENTLIEEDEKVVKNFLEKAQALSNINAQRLNSAVDDKLHKMFKGD